MQRWTSEELAYLTDNYSNFGPAICSATLNRTYRSVTNKAHKLGLKLNKEIIIANLRTLAANSKLSLDEVKNRLFDINMELVGTYVNSQLKTEIKHLECGYTWNVLTNSLFNAKSGCPNCASLKSNIIYIVYFQEINLYKIGITKNIESRLTQFGYKPELLFCMEYLDHKTAFKVEQEILKTLPLVNTGLLKSGNTETFRY